MAQREKMDNAEKGLYKTAQQKGILTLELALNRITWLYADYSARITKLNPSKEFVQKMKDLL